MNTMNIIVIGGSLGGLNAALWLRQVGCNVRVFERAGEAADRAGGRDRAQPGHRALSGAAAAFDVKR